MDEREVVDYKNAKAWVRNAFLNGLSLGLCLSAIVISVYALFT